MKNVKNPIKKLEDVSLESVYGGEGGDPRIKGGVGLVVVSILSGIGCGVASTVCQYKAKSKREHGDVESAEKFEKAGRILSATSLGVGVGGPIAGSLLFTWGAKATSN